MNSAGNFLKQYWVFIFLGILVVLVGVIKISTLKPDQQPSLTPTPAVSRPLFPPPKLGGKPLPQKTTISADLTSLPQTLGVFENKEGQISSAKALKIAQELGFVEPPKEIDDIQLGKFYSWSTNEASLVIGLDSPEIRYNLFLSSFLEKGVLPNANQALEILNGFLDKLEIRPPFNLQAQEVKYFKFGLRGFPETNPQKADFIQVGLTPTLNNYPLVGNDPNKPLVSLLLGPGNKIIRFNYQLYFGEFSPGGSYSLKNPKQIASLLFSEGKIINFDLMTEETWNLDFLEVEINKISLVYFQSPSKEKITQPIFLLTGRGVLTNGQQTRVNVYLPAITF